MDKVIVSHAGALQEKYHEQGFDLIRAAVSALITADADRGLKTQLIFIDDAEAMRRLGGSRSTRAGLVDLDHLDPNDQQETKDAVDAIASALSPDYLALLDGPDVIPHIVLDNPAHKVIDLEPTIASDLPYASSARLSRNVVDYMSITRVVGRIPNVPGTNNPATITQCLKTAAEAKPRVASEYKSYFALSAEHFQSSTVKTIEAAFPGPSELDVTPPAGPPTTNRRFSKLSHFINCHGLPKTPKFFGEQGGDTLAVAMDSSQVAAQAVEGTVVAAECCYGAELYDPNRANVADPICITYIAKGALGFFGSTNIAYGGLDSKPNGRADLMTQYFFEGVLAGASLGKSVGEARQKFIGSQLMADPGNLKTLAQFILLGDPSTIPCTGSSELEDATWRDRFAAHGQDIAKVARVATAGPVSLPESVKQRTQAMAKESGYGETAETFFFPISGWASRAESIEADEHVMVISPTSKEGIGTRYLIYHIVGDDIAWLEEAVSR
jgi:hypothetical protein